MAAQSHQFMAATGIARGLSGNNRRPPGGYCFLLFFILLFFGCSLCSLTHHDIRCYAWIYWRLTPPRYSEMRNAAVGLEYKVLGN